MANEKEAGKATPAWTPEQIIQAFKECVTAFLGVLVLGCTGLLTVRTLRYIGEPSKMTDAKDILQILLGVAGVVIGYYFGRVPADARATQAQEQANTATAQTEQIIAQAQVAAGQVEEVMDKITSAAQPLDTLNGADLLKIRDELRALAAVSRRQRVK